MLKPVRSGTGGSEPPTLFDTLIRFWTRWGRGVPANWGLDQVALLAEVCRAGICLDRQIWDDGEVPGRTAFEVRRGQQADWPADWLDSPVDTMWVDDDEFKGEAGDPSSLVLGYMADSVEHRFACNLRRPAELIALQMTAEGASVLGRPESAVASQMLHLVDRWSPLPLRERGRRQKTVRFSRPREPYQLLVLPDGRASLGLSAAMGRQPPAA